MCNVYGAKKETKRPSFDSNHVIRFHKAVGYGRGYLPQLQLLWQRGGSEAHIASGTNGVPADSLTTDVIKRSKPGTGPRISSSAGR